MSVVRTELCAALLVVLTVPLLAQSDPNVPASPAQPTSQQPEAAPNSPRALGESAPPPGSTLQRRAGQVPCWKEAGISAAKVNERWQIEDNAKVKIAEVCSDSSLTAEKKRDKIRQINEETEQEVAKIIPAKELEAFKACQAQRDREKANRPGRTAVKPLGPCGGVIPAESEAHGHSHEHQMNSNQ